MNKKTQIFNYTGNIQRFIVPKGVSDITIYCWGAGGGSTKLNFNTNISGIGGSGGFIKATLNVSSIESLVVIVGQGGKKGVSNALSGNAFGGGGNGHAGNSEWFIGGGGGLSGIFVNNTTMLNNYQVNTNATAILIAGAGGGSGANDKNSSYAINNGGNGGGDTANSSTGECIASGGTQTTGNSKYMGGNATYFSGGGGGGWYGGATKISCGGGKVGGGGGGSSYINTSSYKITNITNSKNITNGITTAPGNSEIYYQSGIAIGGINNNGILNDGGNGLIVIEYTYTYTKNIYGQDVIEEKKLDYELIKYPSRFPDTIGAIDTKNKEQTFTINNSDYTVKFSSYSDDYKEATPLYLFDGNTNNQNKNENMGGYFGNKTENKYNQTIGTYNGTSSFEGTKGEWVSITFQTSFILKKYGFIAKADREANAPGSWVLYAKTTGNTYQSIDTSSATLTERDYNNVNTLYNKLILDNTVESNTYVFVFTGLTNTTNNNYEDNNLNFIEILLYGIINE